MEYVPIYINEKHRLSLLFLKFSFIRKRLAKNPSLQTPANSCKLRGFGMSDVFLCDVSSDASFYPGIPIVSFFFSAPAKRATSPHKRFPPRHKHSRPVISDPLRCPALAVTTATGSALSRKRKGVIGVMRRIAENARKQ